MSYDVLSRSYLRRAEKLLSDATPESLFYAAFELRCGIEARMYQYLEVQKQVSAKKKKGWQINKLATNIERIFRTGDKVARFAFRKRGRKKPFAVFYYTPVNSKLVKMG